MIQNECCDLIGRGEALGKVAGQVALDAARIVSHAVWARVPGRYISTVCKVYGSIFFTRKD